MVVGIGIGTDLAINGAVAHGSDVIKGLLFMTMGAVIHRVGHCYGSDLGHLASPCPSHCCIGELISAFPLFSGFISKSMVMSAAYALSRRLAHCCL